LDGGKEKLLMYLREPLSIGKVVSLVGGKTILVLEKGVTGDVKKRAHSWEINAPWKDKNQDYLNPVGGRGT